jgi:HSP20 family protein
MAVVKWDPFRDLVSIQDRMNKLFEQTLSRSRGEEGVSATTWTPSVDIYETTDTIVMKAELPGVSREDIQIQTHENTLTLKGERRFAKDVQEESYLRIERAYGSHRAFTLPSVVHQETIPRCSRWVLGTLPKAEGQAKRISIDVRWSAHSERYPASARGVGRIVGGACRRAAVAWSRMGSAGDLLLIGGMIGSSRPSEPRRRGGAIRRGLEPPVDVCETKTDLRIRSSSRDSRAPDSTSCGSVLTIAERPPDPRLARTGPANWCGTACSSDA